MIQKNFASNRLSRLGFNLASVALVLLLFFSVYLMKCFVNYQVSLEQAQNILLKTTSISVLIERSESGYRGYLYSHDVRFLRRYHLAASTIQPEIRELKKLLANHPDQLQSVQKLKEVVTIFYDQHDETLKIHSEKGASVQVMERFRQTDMRDIREALGVIETRVSDWLAETKEESEFLMNSGITLLILGTLISLTLLVGARAFYRDITKSQLLRDEWEKARQVALDTAHLKSEFLIEMGHEIRTPMKGVIGMTDLLLNSSLTVEQKSFAQNIQVSAKYLLNMIHNVLDQSLFERGQLNIEKAPFKIFALAKQVVTLLEPAALEKKIQLFLDTDLDAELEVISDENRIQEVLISIVEQAVRKTEKGFVSLKVKVLEVFDGQARFYFEIKNSSSNFIQNISQSARMKNLLHDEIIKQLQGEIESEYQEGFGSRYSLTLDLKLKSPDEKKIVKRHTQIISEKPVLVVEDQSINQMVIQKYLERFGLSCHVVADGRAAFLEATTQKYCLVLMDCKMQPIDGYEATQLIRTHEKRFGTRIPIVALTADGTLEDRQRCERVGMDDYLIKPIDLEKLENVLQKWIQPILKEEYLKKLAGYKMEGKSLVEVLAEDYFISAPILMRKLEAALLSQDLKQVQYLAHTLKSSSITLGLVELSSYCEKLEYTSEFTPQVQGVMAQIKECYQKSEPVLKKRIQAESSTSISSH